MSVKNKAVLILEGTLQVWDQEGGHAAPSVTIGKTDLTSEIEEFARVQPRAAGSIGGAWGGRWGDGEIGELCGLWKITIERTED